jgi:oxygen-independent coproporphyrinogen-3 oxidase
MSLSLPPWYWPSAAYVHIPFCAHHCGYCDFAVAVGKDHLRDAYLDALAKDLATLGQPQPVQTLFFGGGTPSYLTAQQLARLLAQTTRWLPLAADHEFSVEANPNSMDDEKIRILADHGVNRLSFGVQSFQSHVLRVLERDHEPADVPRALEAARRRIANVSFDLIFGVPGQTVAQWEADLHQAIALGPTHIATYGLTYEKGTRLWKQRQQGVVQALEEEHELSMYTLAMDLLDAAGFEQYEISNFARAGCRCRHNQVYWANHAHFGIGVGAASYVRGERRHNVRDTEAYIRRALAGRPVHFQTETLAPRERALETAGLQMRRAEGIERTGFQGQTGILLDEIAGAALARHCELGLVRDDGGRIALTRAGKCVADAVISELWHVNLGAAPCSPEPQ